MGDTVGNKDLDDISRRCRRRRWSCRNSRFFYQLALVIFETYARLGRFEDPPSHVATGEFLRMGQSVLELFPEPRIAPLDVSVHAEIGFEFRIEIVGRTDLSVEDNDHSGSSLAERLTVSGPEFHSAPDALQKVRRQYDDRASGFFDRTGNLLRYPFAGQPVSEVYAELERPWSFLELRHEIIDDELLVLVGVTYESVVELILVKLVLGDEAETPLSSVEPDLDLSLVTIVQSGQAPDDYSQECHDQAAADYPFYIVGTEVARGHLRDQPVLAETGDLRQVRNHGAIRLNEVPKFLSFAIARQWIRL